MKTKIRSYSPPGEARQGRKERWQRCRWLGLLIMLFMLTAAMPASAGLSNSAPPRWFSKDMDITPADPWMTFEISHLNYDGDNFHWRTFELVVDGVNIGSISQIGCNVSCGWKNDEGKWEGRSGWMRSNDGVTKYYVKTGNHNQGNDKYKYTFIYVYFPTNTLGQKHTLEVNGVWVGKDGSTTTTYGPDKSKHIKFTSNAVSFTTPNGCGSYERTAPGKITWKPSNSVTAASGYSHRYEFRLNDAGNWIKNSNPNANYVLSGINDSEQQAYHTRYVQYKTVTLGSESKEVTFTRDWQKTESGNIIKACTMPTDLEVSTDIWEKTIELTWKKEATNRLTNGKFHIFRYENGDPTTREKIGTVNYDAPLTFTDRNKEYKKQYTYEVSFILNTWENEAPVSDLTATKTVTLTQVFTFSDLIATPKEKSVLLSWSHAKPTNNSQLKFKVWRCLYNADLKRANGTYDMAKVKTAFGNDPIATVSAASQGTTTNYEDFTPSNSNTRYLYAISVEALDSVFYSDLIGPATILGNTEILSMSANRGTYTDVVKVQWEVKQMGTDPTRFMLYRRLLGSNNDEDYQIIWETTGTESSYYYEDSRALAGQFYQYRVVAQSKYLNDDNQLVYDDVSSKICDGFCQTRGIISGRITYGTGTAVANARVLLAKSGEGDNDSKQFYSMKVYSQGGIRWQPTENAGKTLFQQHPFTFQLYVRPETVVDGGSMIIDGGGHFSLQLKPAADKQSELYLQVGSADAQATGLKIANGKFHNVSLTNDGATGWKVRVVVTDTLAGDTVLTKELTSTAITWTPSDVVFGCDKEFTTAHAFTGYLDDIRLWAKALTDDELLDNYDRLLIGSEQGLKLYWPMDEGVSALPFAYDYSKSSGVANENHGKKESNTAFSEEVPTKNQLRLYGKTDEQGNYVIRGIPFTGEGTSYIVQPMLGIHEFSPAYQTRFVNKEALTHSGVDFEDVSSFPVSGTIYYAGTDYPVEGVTFQVDGTICSKDGEMIKTNAQGKYTISVPIGDHFITVEKNGHVFANAGRYPADNNGTGERHTFNQEVKNLDFYDNTLVNFTGRVVGGKIEGDKTVGFGQSNNNIGVTEMVLTPLNEIPRMNVVKETSATKYGYKTNPDTVGISSASKRINSTSWRGAGADDCKKLFIRTDAATGEFSAMLPPLQYKVSAMKVVKTGLEVGASTTVDLTEPLMTYSDTLYLDDDTYELYEYNTMLKQTYHSTPTFLVTQEGHQDGAFGIDSVRIEDNDGTFDITDIYTIGANGKPVYKYGGAVFEMSERYTFNFEAFEEYVNSDGTEAVTDHVPLSGLVVTIENALSDQQPVYVEDGVVDGENVKAGDVVELRSNQLQLDSLGLGTYTWTAGLPNISKPYTRTISMTYEIEDRTYPWSGNGMEGIVLGASPTGNNFVTSGPDALSMILRDPPGSGSFAEWAKGTVTNTSSSDLGVWNSETHLTTTSKLGVDVTTIQGTPGFGVINNIEAKSDLEVGIKINIEGEAGNTWSQSVETMKTISTSSDPEYVGADGDVFIGSATNVIFGKARILNFKRDGSSVKLSVDNGITTGLSFATSFSYTQKYIENTLLPNLEALRNTLLLRTVTSDEYPRYVSKVPADDPRFGSANNDKVWGSAATKSASPEGPSYDMIVPDEEKDYQDSVQWCNNQIDTWKVYLAFNEQEKVMAYDMRNDKDMVEEYDNYSFDAGTTVNKSHEVEEGHGSKYSMQYALGVHLNRNWGVTIRKTGVIFDVGTETSAGYHREYETMTSDKEVQNFTLAESGDDALSVDVYKFGAYGRIFRTRGGQTSAPYEGKEVTKYYAPGTTIMEATMQIEVPTIAVDVASVSDVPTGSAADYTLRLGNESEIGSDVAYKLFVLDETNPYGAQISIDGKVLTEGRLIKVPANQTLTKALQLRQTNTSVLDYVGIDDDRLSDHPLYKRGIGIVFASDSQPEEIADTVFITASFVPSSSTVDLALSNTILNTQTGNNLVLTFSNFDRNYHNLKAFRLQYKKQGATDWTLLKEYVLKEADLTANNQLLPEKGASVSYTLPMENFTDGDYTFRVVSAATYGTDEVYRYSNEVALVKDMMRPRPLGLPEPSDGILDIGDEISVTFNETILKGELTKAANFEVTGVLNGAQIDHATALSMQNTETTAATEANITLANKDFSIDTWVNLSGEGTILSHGTGKSKMTVGTDASGHLVVKIGSTTYTSAGSVPTGKWAFLTLCYENTDAGGKLNASVATDDQTIDLLVNQEVAAYKGNGPLTVGKQMTGAIHELLLWDEAHDMATALMNRRITKSPATRHLIGYWKMNEGEGTEIRDYARNRHMTMPAETWYLNNVNKAVSLDGQHLIRIDASQINAFPGDDAAIEFWMRGEAQTAEAQLLQMGEVGLWTNAAGELQLTSKGANKPAEQMTSLATSSGNILNNTWHHIALNILRQGAATVYVDGKRVLNTNGANIGTIATDKLLVGARRVDGSYSIPFKGEVDEVRVWNATLNADKLLANRKLRLTGREDGLVAYYPFEKDTLDSGNQPVTIGFAKDFSGSSLMAQLTAITGSTSELTGYTDQAPALRKKPTETNVGFTFTASDNKVVIDIDEDADIVEGCTLNFTVQDLRDVNGNYSKPVAWSAFVSRKQLAWKDDVVAVEQQLNTGSSVTATLVNKGGTAQVWTLSGLPAWITTASEYGTTNPQSETAITFAIAPSAPLGRHEVTVYATGSDNIAVPLTIRVRVVGEEPLWTVNKALYQETMNLIGTLQVLGVTSQDEDDIIGAFIGDECRGVSHLEYNQRYDGYFVTMDIYGNDEDNKPIEFKAYDASSGIIYPVVKAYKYNETQATALTFEPGMVSGRYATPMTLAATDDIEQNIELNSGWNWMSLSVKPTPMTVATVFAKADGKVNTVKSLKKVTGCDNGSWVGDFAMSNTDMYAVNATEALTLSVTGQRVNTSETPITIAEGWNWIGYCGQAVISVGDALAGLNPQDGDIIKGQKGVAYFDVNAWSGSLQTLVPGKGYKLQSATGGRTFTYPATAAASRMYKEADLDGESRATGTFAPVDYSSYPTNMVLIAKVVKNGMPVNGAELGVFAGSECREAAVTDGQGMVYITIPGDNAEKLTFRVAEDEFVLKANESVDYKTDAVIGTPRTPFFIELGTATAVGSVATESQQTEQVFDLQGRKVKVDDRTRKLRKGVYIVNGQKQVK